jgi:hypothetical protein
VNIKDVKTVYALMNTDWGSTAKGLLAITFTGTGGAIWNYDPIGNVNIRDYNNGFYTDAIGCALPTGPGTAATVTGFKTPRGNASTCRFTNFQPPSQDRLWSASR